jgi:hypothetical protein
MKVLRPKWGTRGRPERITFQAPVGTKKILERMTDELSLADQESTQVSDTVNAILNSNRDYQRIQRKFQKEAHDTSTNNQTNSGTPTQDADNSN